MGLLLPPLLRERVRVRGRLKIENGKLKMENY